MSEHFLSREELRAFDKHAIENLGIPAAVLMENAGRGAAEYFLHRHILANGPIVICCGKGNNGGDGLVMARHLGNCGYRTHSLLFSPVIQLSPDAALQWNIVQQMELPSQVIETLDETSLRQMLEEADWIVDALFGIGLMGSVRAPYDRIIELINHSGKPILALDIPSGVDCNTGEPLGAAIRATHTATFHLQKLGFKNPKAKQYTGQVNIVPIGIGHQFISRGRKRKSKKTKKDGP